MELRPAGFWLRLGAFWIDAILAFVAAWIVVKAAYSGGYYWPFEATLLLLLVTQAIVVTAMLGGTVGKLACGLQVAQHDASRVRWLPTLLRETFGKLISLAPLGLGFIWIGCSHSKRGWHDYLVRTMVRRRWPLTGANKLALAVSFGILATATAAIVNEWAAAVVLYRSMAPHQDQPLAFEQRDVATLVDVSNIPSNEHGRFLDWIDRQGQPPIDYVVDKARKYQVVIIGEIHEQHELLQFLNELVPRLYHDAGVTRIAMECCPAARDTDLEKLLTAGTFDRDLLISIARQGAGGQPWGFQEYWDVLETVWKLNQSLPPDKPKMLVIGLSPNLDEPSLTLLVADGAPWYERLRVLRLPVAMPALITSDAFYARQIEQQIIQPAYRGVVWVGYAHACLDAPNPWATDRSSYPRMGYMLRQKYGDRLFQIRMHAPMIRLVDFDPTQPAVRARLPAFLNELFDERNSRPVGFDLAESPFAPLRDKTLWEDYMAPRMAFGDRAEGYVMLLRSDRLNKCRWIPDFVTPEMYCRLKPYYQALTHKEGKSIVDADGFNAIFSKPFSSLPQ